MVSLLPAKYTFKDNSVVKRKSYRRNGEYLAKLTAVLTAYSTGREIYDQLAEKYRLRNAHFVSISFDDPIITTLVNEISKIAIHNPKRRTLSSTAADFILGFRNNDVIKIDIDGHKITCNVAQDESPKRKDDWSVRSRPAIGPHYLEFHCKTAEQSEIVVNWLDEIRAKHYKTDTRPKIWSATSWDEWRAFKDLPVRSLDSVFMKKGEKEFLVEDLERFYASEQLYSDAGLPYHRGYMLFGPAGTGKTSIITALAERFGKHVCFMPISALRSDISIVELFSYIPKDSFLVIEDVDTSSAVKSRDMEVTRAAPDDKIALYDKERTNLSTMLNTMDGLLSPHGLVLFMTTNHVEMLDESIVRPGRIDVLLEIDQLDTAQLNEMVGYFIGDPSFDGWTEEIYNLRIMPAEVSELFKRCLDNKTSCFGMIDELIAVRKEVHQHFGDGLTSFKLTPEQFAEFEKSLDEDKVSPELVELLRSRTVFDLKEGEVADPKAQTTPTKSGDVKGRKKTKRRIKASHTTHRSWSQIKSQKKTSGT